MLSSESTAFTSLVEDLVGKQHCEYLFDVLDVHNSLLGEDTLISAESLLARAQLAQIMIMAL